MTAPYQSKLIPHEDFIRHCRLKRWSYPRIAKALRDQHGIQISASTIFAFVKVRAKKREVFQLPAKADHSTSVSKSTNLADGFFLPAPAQPRKPNEAKRPKFNLDF